MTYTEIKERNGKKYYYRVRTLREGKKFRKKRIYLGKDLSKKELSIKERDSDKILNDLNNLKGLKKLTPKIIEILKKYGVKKAGVFGSYARGEQKKKSDIDLLIEAPKGMGLRFVGLGIELEEKLGRKVHLVTYKYINPYIKNEILKDEVKIIWFLEILFMLNTY